jgi:hypothetical protein
VIGNSSIRDNTINFLVIVIKFLCFFKQVRSQLIYTIKWGIGIVGYSLLRFYLGFVHAKINKKRQKGKLIRTFLHKVVLDYIKEELTVSGSFYLNTLSLHL